MFTPALEQGGCKSSAFCDFIKMPKGVALCRQQLFDVKEKFSSVTISCNDQRRRQSLTLGAAHCCRASGTPHQVALSNTLVRASMARRWHGVYSDYYSNRCQTDGDSWQERESSENAPSNIDCCCAPQLSAGTSGGGCWVHTTSCCS